MIQPYNAAVLTKGSVILSRDGRRLVYSDFSQPGIFVRELDRTEGRVLPGIAGGNPFLSPDGEWLGFYGDGKMKKVALAGGDPIAICDVPERSPGAAWGKDGSILFTPSWTTGLRRVDASGGQPVEITSPEKHTAHVWPDFLPDGRAVLFTIFGGAGLSNAKVALLDLETKRYDVLLDGAAGRYVPSGHLVFFRAGGYFAVPFDASRRRVTGPERRVLRDAKPLDPVGNLESYFSFSDTGRLAFVPGAAAPRSRLAWISRDGHTQELPFEGDHYGALRLAPDQRRVAVDRLDGGDVQVWIYDLARGTQEKLTRDGQNFGPAWHPDGSRLAYTAARASFDVRSALADGSRPPEDLVASDLDEMNWAWSPDGRSAVVQVLSPDTGSDIWSVDPSRPEERRPLVVSPLSDSAPEISPDGRWLAYRSGGLYVARYPDLTARTVVGLASSEAHWSRASPELFYIQAGRLMSLRYEARPDSLRLLPPRPLFDVPLDAGDNAGFDVSADASRFLFLVPVPGQRRSDGIHVVVDGFAELQQPAAPQSP